MYLITRRTLEKFAKQYQLHADSLYAWAAVVEAASWKCPTDIVQSWGSVDIIHTGKNVLPTGDCRVVFDIAGNHLRMVAHVNFPFQSVYIKDCLTHKEYDNINFRIYKYETKEKSHDKK
jgi:mRNA interferase HigB